MKIQEFDIKKGIYSFEFDEMNTEKHSHPVVEIINADKGSFSLELNNQVKENLVFAIINSNVEHSVFSKNCSMKILMVESHNSKLSSFLENRKISFQNGVFLTTNYAKKDELFSEVEKFVREEDLKTPEDKRVAESINFIEENDLEYQHLISKLTSRVYLSSSRLSHLLKDQIGISIKKYLVWNRLRQAINLYLNEKTSLTEVSLESGFFDQAHLTNSFKNVLGVSPSKAYNSRILQS